MSKLRLEIEEDENTGERWIEILYDEYNIKQETIYDSDLATQIYELVHRNRQTTEGDSPF